METIIRSLVRAIWAKIEPIKNDVAVIKTVTPSLRADIDQLNEIFLTNRFIHKDTFNSAIDGLHQRILALESATQVNPVDVAQIVEEEISANPNFSHPPESTPA